ncbi:MAG TPA: TadE/TadG family type IV pilus assembly protein [Caulobacteraceae bacterium]|jgi:Flp pilus assembly protein TadG
MKFLRDFLERQGGASAIEFAIIAPILAGLTIYGFDAWQLINAKQDMHAAINATSHYYMGGGSDDPTGQSIGLSGWPNKPSDGAMAIVRACTCAGVAATCSSICSNTQQATEIHLTMTATRQWNGLHPAALSETENVRVR